MFDTEDPSANEMVRGTTAAGGESLKQNCPPLTLTLTLTLALVLVLVLVLVLCAVPVRDVQLEQC
jgi:hypothetical protein